MCTTEGTCATRANLTPLPRYFWKPFLSWVCVTNTSVYLAGDVQLRLLTNQAVVCLQLFSLGKSFWDWLYSSLYFELEYLQESRWWACPWEKKRHPLLPPSWWFMLVGQQDCQPLLCCLCLEQLWVPNESRSWSSDFWHGQSARSCSVPEPILQRWEAGRHLSSPWAAASTPPPGCSRETCSR